MKTRSFILILLISGCSSSIFAHNTNVIHPLITIEALKLIKEEDQNADANLLKAYSELYFTQDEENRYWGNNPYFDEGDAIEDEEKDYEAFRSQPLNVMGGVVMEDHPVHRVFSHFYHAYSGIPMTLGGKWRIELTPSINFPRDPLYDPLLGLYGIKEPSKRTAVRFFDQSIEAFGYLDEDMDPDGFEGANQEKELGLWLFGHSLHHLEDMSSVGHVTNDAHIDKFAYILRDRDDYEAHYLPSKIWGESQHINKLFEVSEAYKSNTDKSEFAPKVIASFDQIWPSPIKNPEDLVVGQDGSLETESLARTVYNYAHFQGQLSFPRFWIHKLWEVSSTSCLAEGEIEEMFRISDSKCGLRLEIRNPFSSYWVIDGIGFYFYENFNGNWFSEWWEASEFGGPPGYYYIEQIMDGVDMGKKYKDTNLVFPRRMREDFHRRYDKLSNAVVLNKTGPGDDGSIARQYAEALVPLAVRYAAGYGKFWYDIVNTPPYLKHVQVFQQGQSVYASYWKDEYASRDLVLKYEEEWNKDVAISMTYVKSRHLTPDPNYPVVGFINPNKEFEMRLIFNEPIRDPNTEDSGFSIGFDNSINLEIGTHYNVTNCTDYEPAQKNPSDWMQGRCWDVKVMSAMLPQDFNGRVKLKVKARDLNNHHGDIGAELDDDPSTPARRQRRNPSLPREDFVEGQVGWDGPNSYPWHTTSSIDINFDMKPGDFAYTFGEGDTNHVLLFDSQAPEIELR